MITWKYRRFGRLAGAAVLIWLLAGGRLQAADMASDQPVYGVRFTPGMARAMAAVYTHELLKSRYELPADKIDEAREKIARRLMQMAHRIEEPSQELLERLIVEKMNGEADGRDESAMLTGLGKEFSDRVLPMIPEIREMVRGVVQDVRPMLPMKQQLKMAGDMSGVMMAINGFEEVMKKWSSGEIKDFQDPFNTRRINKDKDGETADLKFARDKAQRAINKPRAKAWAEYVESFKKLYELDAAQSAAADSILQEFSEREAALRADAMWREQIYRGQMWNQISWMLPRAWLHPARTLIEEQNQRARLTWNQLEEDFKVRLETVSTAAQRRMVDQKVESLLKKKRLWLAEAQP